MNSKGCIPEVKKSDEPFSELCDCIPNDITNINDETENLVIKHIQRFEKKRQQ
jgi:hypothetical protein